MKFNLIDMRHTTSNSPKLNIHCRLNENKGCPTRSVLNTESKKQESTPVGCVPNAFPVPVGGGVLPPPVDRQTPVKTLPCPKLRFRAVNMTSTTKKKLTLEC